MTQVKIYRSNYFSCENKIKKIYIFIVLFDFYFFRHPRNLPQNWSLVNGMSASVYVCARFI